MLNFNASYHVALKLWAYVLIETTNPNNVNPPSQTSFKNHSSVLVVLSFILVTSEKRFPL